MKVQAMVKLRSRGIHGRKLIILGYSCVKNSRCATLDYRAANTKPVTARNGSI